MVLSNTNFVGCEKMQNNVIFKSSTFGFDKKEVMNYIASLCERNAENVKQLNLARNELQNFAQENEKLKRDNVLLFEDNKVLNQSVQDLKSTIETLQKEVAELNEINAKIAEIEAAEEKANKLMMDSLKYSESCINNARQVSASISLSTKNKIDKAKTCLNTVSDDFRTLSSKLEISISEISDRLSALSDGLETTDKK